MNAPTPTRSAIRDSSDLTSAASDVAPNVASNAASQVAPQIAPQIATQIATLNTDPDSQAALPKHVAIIMDGNGRWATGQGMDRSYGHHQGAKRVPPLVEHCSKLGIQALTLYSFSTENWTRSQDEVDFLMALCVEFLQMQRQSLIDNNIQFRHVGHREGLPQEVLTALDETTDLTRQHTGMTLCLAINYGARSEMVAAVQAIANRVALGEIAPDVIDEQMISDHLFTSGLPDPDLLIRTAGELRVSNYLLWQISYAELYVAQCCWPEFDLAGFDLALASFGQRQRKFGAVVDTV